MANIAQISDIGISILSKSQIGLPVQLTRTVVLNSTIEDGTITFVNSTQYIESYGIDELLFIDSDHTAMIRSVIHNQSMRLATDKTAKSIAVLAIHYETGNEVVYAYFNFGSPELLPARTSSYYEQIFDLQVKLTRNTRVADGEIKPPYLATKKDIIDHNLDANAHPLYNLWIATLSGNVKLKEYPIQLGPGAYRSIPRDASKSYVAFLPSVERKLYLAGNISYDRSLATDAYLSSLYYADNAQLVPGYKTDYGQDYPSSKRYGTTRMRRGVLVAATTTSYTDTSSSAIAALKSMVLIQDIKDRRWSYVISYGSVKDTPEAVGDSIIEIENPEDTADFNLYCVNQHSFVKFNTAMSKAAKTTLSNTTTLKNTDMRVVKGKLIICGYFEKSSRIYGFIETIDKVTGLRLDFKVFKPANLSGTSLGDVRLHQIHYEEDSDRMFLVGEYKSYSGTWGALITECNSTTFEAITPAVFTSKYGDTFTYLASATHSTQEDIFALYSLDETRQLMVAYSKATATIRYIKLIMNAKMKKGEMAISPQGELMIATPSSDCTFWSNTIGYKNVALSSIGLSNILEDPYLIDDSAVKFSRVIYDEATGYFYLSGYTENQLATMRISPLTKYTLSAAADGKIEFLSPLKKVTESSAYTYYFETSVIALVSQAAFSDTPKRVVDATESETIGFYQTDMYVNKLTPDNVTPPVDDDPYITKFYSIQTTDYITIVSDAIRTTNSVGPSSFNVASEEDPDKQASIQWAVGVSDTLNGRWTYYVYNMSTHCWQTLEYMDEYRNGILTGSDGTVTYTYEVPEAALAHLVTNYGMDTTTLTNIPTESIKLITRNYIRLIGMAGYTIRPSDYVLYRPKFTTEKVNGEDQCTPAMWWYSLSINDLPLMEFQPDARDYENDYNPYLVNKALNTAYSLYQRSDVENVQIPTAMEQIEITPLFSYTGIWYDRFTKQVITTWKKLGTNTYENPKTLEHIQIILNSDISICDDEHPNFCFAYDQESFTLELHCEATRIICLDPSAGEYVSINMVNTGVRKILNCKLCESYQNDVLDSNEEYKCMMTCDTSYPKVSKITMGMTSSGVTLDLLQGVLSINFTSSNIIVLNTSKYEDINAKLYLFERPTSLSGNNVVFYEFSYDLWNSVS